MSKTFDGMNSLVVLQLTKDLNKRLF